MECTIWTNISIPTGSLFHSKIRNQRLPRVDHSIEAKKRQRLCWLKSFCETTIRFKRLQRRADINCKSLQKWNRRDSEKNIMSPDLLSGRELPYTWYRAEGKNIACGTQIVYLPAVQLAYSKTKKEINFSNSSLSLALSFGEKSLNINIFRESRKERALIPFCVFEMAIWCALRSSRHERQSLKSRLLRCDNTVISLCPSTKKEKGRAENGTWFFPFFKTGKKTAPSIRGLSLFCADARLCRKNYLSNLSISFWTRQYMHCSA